MLRHMQTGGQPGVRFIPRSEGLNRRAIFKTVGVY